MHARGLGYCSHAEKFGYKVPSHPCLQWFQVTSPHYTAGAWEKCVNTRGGLRCILSKQPLTRCQWGKSKTLQKPKSALKTSNNKLAPHGWLGKRTFNPRAVGNEFICMSVKANLLLAPFTAKLWLPSMRSRWAVFGQQECLCINSMLRSKRTCAPRRNGQMPVMYGCRPKSCLLQYIRLYVNILLCYALVI